ncbi:MAG TPA: hypothetical protein VGQ96_04650, partial [Candidatus Eremiobacteraceae bacterium]|nr:hypothetical protein [Candidatus Eremiobacteraceae bacterium]
YCTGLGTVMSSESVAIGVLRQIRSRVAKNGVRKLDVVSDPGVATQLLGWYKDEFEKLARDHELDIALYVEPGHHREQVVVEEARRMRATPLTGTVVEAELLPVRLPNPASGVAEVNGYLIEIKDAANATGQTVKLKVAAVEGNLVRAELAEPLPTAGRRRRGQRGRGKDVAASDAPIAPPAPSLRDVAAAADGRHRGEEPEHRPARLRRPETVAFSVADDEEAPRVAAPAARSGQAARQSKGRPPSGRGEAPTRGGRRRPGAGRGAPPSHQQPLVVGGEGDIDYDDGDQDAVITSPTVPVGRQVRPAETDSDGADGPARRRRRRRGRGGKGRGSEAPVSNGASTGEDETEPIYDTHENVGRSDRFAQPGDIRERGPRQQAPAPYDEDEDADDEMTAVVDPRQPAPGNRPAKRFGPVRQLYGRPVDLDETRARSDRPIREESRGKRPQGESGQARPQRPSQSRQARPVDDEELDVVIQPKGPAAIHVEMRADLPVRRKPSFERERDERGPREPRVDRGRDDRGPREPRVDRGRDDRRPVDREQGPRTDRPDRPERGDRRERRDGGSRFGGRTRQPAPKREGPTVRQLYPRPDQTAAVEEAPEPNEEATKPKPGFGRQPRGPLMRPTDAPPVPKGKVRQLYPPPAETGEVTAPVEATPANDEVHFDEVGDEQFGSVFISDAEELDERRRRARERAQARRRSEAGDGEGATQASPDQAQPKPQDPDVPESDEWPVF